MILVEPFFYEYMRTALITSVLVGGVCAFLSAYLVLKGWSFMGDALGHAVVPGVALSYLLALPYVVGAFVSGLLAALAMYTVKKTTKLPEDVSIGIVFTGFLAAGLFLVSLSPISVDLQTIMFGNILAISPQEGYQIMIICAVAFIVLMAKWRDFMLLFFDASYAQVAGIHAIALNVVFFATLAAVIVAALQTVGAALVVAMVITPGATAYLLTDRFHQMLIFSVFIGMFSCFIGVYGSYFWDIPSGPSAVIVQVLFFLFVQVFAPKYGLLSKKSI